MALEQLLSLAGEEGQPVISGFIAHLKSLTQEQLDIWEELQREVQNPEMPLTDAGRKTLLMDLADYPFVSPELRDKIRDRLNRSLVQKPQEMHKKRPTRLVELSGHERTLPPGVIE